MVWPPRLGVGGGLELPFAGRDAELGDLEGDLAAAEAGRSRMVAVSGAHGAGKSRLLEELAAIAKRRGFAVASARGVDQTGSPPMWCWRQLVSDLMSVVDPLTRASVVGAHGPVIGGLLTPDGGPDGTDRESASAAFRLMEAISMTLRDIARRRPILGEPR